MVEVIRGPLAVGAALVLAAVLVWAAVAKLGDRERTAREFESLGLAAARPLAGAVPVIELILALALVVVPGWGGLGAFALLTAFTVIIARILADPEGLRPPCACFGGTSRAPLSARHLLRNAALMVLALVAASFDGTVTTIL